MRRTRTLYRLFGVLLVAVVSSWGAAYAQDCDPLKPPQTMKSEVSQDIKANANVLFRQLGSADFEDQTKKTQEDLQVKYPNADKLEIWRSLIYFQCTLLKDSHMSDDEKQKKFESLMNEYLQKPTSQQSPDSETAWLDSEAIGKWAIEYCASYSRYDDDESMAKVEADRRFDMDEAFTKLTNLGEKAALLRWEDSYKQDYRLILYGYSDNKVAANDLSRIVALATSLTHSDMCKNDPRIVNLTLLCTSRHFISHTADIPRYRCKV